MIFSFFRKSINKIARESKIARKRSITARKNSERRFGEKEAMERKKFAFSLREGRQWDRRGSWGISFNADLNELNHFFGFDISKYIKGLGKGKKVVASIGCGTGKAESQLKRRMKKEMELHTTGVRRISAWKKHKNTGKINWHVAHGRNLSKVLGKERFDFVFSRLGIHHSRSLVSYRNDVAWRELSKILKKGGKAVINMEGQFLENELPKDLKIISNIKIEEKDFRGIPNYSTRTLLLEKV